MKKKLATLAALCQIMARSTDKKAIRYAGVEYGKIQAPDNAISRYAAAVGVLSMELAGANQLNADLHAKVRALEIDLECAAIFGFDEMEVSA